MWPFQIFSSYRDKNARYRDTKQNITTHLSSENEMNDASERTRRHLARICMITQFLKNTEKI